MKETSNNFSVCVCVCAVNMQIYLACSSFRACVCVSVNIQIYLSCSSCSRALIECVCVCVCVCACITAAAQEGLEPFCIRVVQRHSGSPGVSKAPMPRESARGARGCARALVRPGPAQSAAEPFRIRRPGEGQGKILLVLRRHPGGVPTKVGRGAG